MQINIFEFSLVFNNINLIFRVSYVHEAVTEEFKGQVYEPCEYYELLPKNTDPMIWKPIDIKNLIRKLAREYSASRQVGRKHSELNMQQVWKRKEEQAYPDVLDVYCAWSDWAHISKIINYVQE